MTKVISVPLAPTGSTGNNTHTPITLGDGFDTLNFDIFVEAVGATPTCTFTIQGSDTGASGVATDWTNLWYVPGGGGAAGAPAASDTATAAAVVLTGVGKCFLHAQNPHIRRFKFYRLVSSANTNVTYSAIAYGFDYQY